MAPTQTKYFQTNQHADGRAKFKNEAFTIANTSHHDNVLSTTPEYPDPHEATMLVAKELNELSIKEREKIYEDIHGVSQLMHEDPEFVAECLHLFQLELDKIQHKPAYDLAMQQNPNRIGGKSMRLMFLRAKEFDVKRAATSFVTYFEHKRIYFGDEVLGRPIYYADLDSDDLACLKHGWFQVLPFRDKSGRAIVWVVDKHKSFETAKCAMKSYWYRIMTLLEDEETQKRGIVFVGTGMEEIDMSQKARDLFFVSAKMLDYMPMKYASAHFCLTNAIPLPMISLMLLATGKEVRTRTRVHYGSDTEWRYSLLTFGIPVQHAPITYIGDLKLKNHRQWIKRRRRIEPEPNKKKRLPHLQDEDEPIPIGIELPRKIDILLGKGVPLQQHPGNIQFLDFVDTFKNEYEGATNKEKKKIINTVYSQIVNDMSIQFLEQDVDGWWIEVSEEVAYKKISHRLRLKKSQAPAKLKYASKTPPPSFIGEKESVVDDDDDGNPGCRCFSSKNHHNDVDKQKLVWH